MFFATKGEVRKTKEYVGLFYVGGYYSFGGKEALKAKQYRLAKSACMVVSKYVLLK